MFTDRIGIIAGNRNLPLILIDEARRKGIKNICTVAFRGITVPEVAEAVDDIFYISIGQFGKMLKYFTSKNITSIYMIGQIPPRLLFKEIKFDARGLMLFRKVYNKGADHVFGTIASEMEKEGLFLKDPTELLKDLIPSEGVLVGKLSKNIKKDIEFGREIAKNIASMDIGQTVVVKNGAVLAVEALEGTDAAISRGAELGGDGITVVKVNSHRKDMRFDIPVAGMDTIDLLIELKAAAFIVDACKTLFLEKEQMIKKAKDNGLIIAAY